MPAVPEERRRVKVTLYDDLYRREASNPASPLSRFYAVVKGRAALAERRSVSERLRAKDAA